MIYLDNSATSWPKPPSVVSAMVRFLEEVGANPGRSGHGPSIEAGRIVFDTRVLVADLFRFDDPLAVVFTKNATEALNLALFGYLVPGDHVVTSSMEHNSVMRPLRELASQGVAVTRVPALSDGTISPDDVLSAVTPLTRMVVLNHAGNVVGTVCDVGEVGRRLRDMDVLLCVDSAQSAGVVEIDMSAMGIDLLVFTGHKSLLGPQGTGGLCIGARARGRLRPRMLGGTGSRSDSDIHPDFLPDRFEAGTLNAVGLAGLGAGIRFIAERGLANIREHEIALTRRLLDGLMGIDGVRVYGPSDVRRRTAVVSFTLSGRDAGAVAMELEDRAGVCCGVGLHCAPMAHQQIGTFPDGTMRLSPGPFTTESEIDATLAVLREVAGI